MTTGITDGLARAWIGPPRISSDHDFQDRIDREDPFICNQDTLQQLLDDAPDQYSQGFLAGVYLFRQQLSILTDRPF